mgnify:FL=1|jgi:HSP20 family protein
MSSRNPFEELERVFSRMSQQFDETTGIRELEVPGLGRGYESPTVDLVERDDEFVLAIDLPGFEREDLEVKTTDRTLRVQAEKEATFDEERDRFVRHERRQQSIDRSIRLPSQVNPEKVDAEMRNGVLTVTLPRVAGQSEHRIDIE